MNVTDIEEFLKIHHIRKTSYNLYGPGSGDEYCIENSNKGWEVYYHERGIKIDTNYFEKESDACKYFIETILKDNTAKEI